MYDFKILYPFCMLTIQLPSDMPIGAPPTILVLLWTKHLTGDGLTRKAETHNNTHPIYILIFNVV